MLRFMRGDVRKTTASALLLGLNQRGQADVTPLETDLRDLYPVFFSEYRRQTRSGQLPVGALWFFRDSRPILLAGILRESPSAPTRLRHLENVLVALRQEWQRESLDSLAIAPLGDELEWPALRVLLEDYLTLLPIPIDIYEAYIPDHP